jgi:hypothetical protein
MDCPRLPKTYDNFLKVVKSHNKDLFNFLQNKIPAVDCRLWTMKILKSLR